MIFDTYPRLENEKIVLKKISIDDLSALKSMVKEKEIYRYEPTFLPELVSSDLNQFILKDCDTLFNDKKNIILGIYLKDNLQFIGIGELYGYSSVRNKISIGYRLKKEYWNHGIATSVVTLLKDYILNELKMKQITAHVEADNIASAKCLLNNGFVLRRSTHKEDWGFKDKIMADKYVIYIKDEKNEK